jgi:ribonuclease HI
MMGGKTPRRTVVRAPQKVPHSVRGRTAHHPGSRSQLVPEGRTGPGAPIKIYTDGGCLVHEDGAGGYAAVICLPNGNRKELSGGVDMTNSSRMELLAAVAALRTLESMAKIGASVELYTDSQYLYQGVTSRIWQTSGNQVETLLNKDLWIELSNLVEAYEIEWFWVKGHNGNLMNERCDWLATAAAKRTVAEKKWVPDFAKQLETAKNRIKELERINKKLTSDADRFHLLTDGKLSTADKDLFHAVYHESLTGFVRWKLRRWFTKQRH